MPRLADVASGAVFFNGVDVRTLSLEDLRGRTAVVSQEGGLPQSQRCGKSKGQVSIPDAIS